jgi:hypothetical protein
MKKETASSKVSASTDTSRSGCCKAFGISEGLHFCPSSEIIAQNPPERLINWVLPWIVFICNVRCVVCGLRFAVCGLRYAVCGLRFAVCGVRFAVCSLRYVVYCSLLTVHCSLWSVSGAEPLIYCFYAFNFGNR